LPPRRGGANRNDRPQAGKKEGGWGEGIFARPRLSAEASAQAGSAAAKFRIALMRKTPL